MKGICLLSSGLDSVAALAIAKKKMDIALALTFDYGQRSAAIEKSFSKKICDHYNIIHKTIQLGWLEAITTTSLVNKEKSLPEPSTKDLFSETATKTAASVWVPNRNGLMLNIAACFAETMDCEFIIVGFNAEEAATFPDNSPKFVDAANLFFTYSTLKGVKVYAPLLGMDKESIVKTSLENDAPLKWSWSCYASGPDPCGVCESCKRRSLAFEKIGRADPLFAETEGISQ
ncbi:7-cyano-7-deazaguanine synthase QueC [Methanohalophilus sp.]|uniref:7-cyano-7-deazaguanine synthase QueC n=1 Tax=Methanohalophilus sp. TaxID=1966352 RepID=UPI00262F9BE2|nr:7-cyano-7-deazaguanine synthase QueC [Methanohalophilus sp.]MDK2892316.1 7-cyano-7-deazaguanine synthase [Methanohalophilus sp.]